MKHHISYHTEYGVQAVSSADRPLCSLVSATSAARQGRKVKLAGESLDLEGMQPLWSDTLVPENRLGLWLQGLDGARLTADFTPIVGDKRMSPYQVATINAISVAGGVLNLGCGLGKTLTAVGAVCQATLRRPGRVSRTRCWIVCPLNAFSAWRPYVPHLEEIFAEVNIISMDSLHKVTGCANIGGCIIFDECHLLGEPTARRTKAAHQIRPMFDFALCLTGTLLHGGIHKALSVLDLAVPGGAVFSSKWKAGEHFKVLVKKKVGQRTFTELARPTGVNKERFMAYLSRLTIAMTKDSEAVKSDVTIPEQLLQTVEIGDCSRDLTELAVEIIHKHMAENNGEVPHAMAVAQALCQEGVSAKLDWLFDQIDDDTPVVAFAQYTETLDETQTRLEQSGISFVRVDGPVTGRQREEALRRFQSGEVQVFLGQITAAGISADLQRSFVSVAIDHTWRAADYAQALARTCRRGQTLTCHHFDLVTNRLQKQIVARLRLATDFDASTSEWQALKAARQDPHFEAATGVLIEAFKNDPETIAAKAEEESA